MMFKQVGARPSILKMLTDLRGIRRANYGTIAMLNSLLLQEPQIEHPEHQDNYDVHDQPHPEPVPQEQDVHAHHDDYQREHVKHDACLISHPSFLHTLRSIDHPLKAY